MKNYNERLKAEAQARGYLNWKGFKAAEPDKAETIRLEIVKDEQEVGLW
ncbi:hypothetical protein WOSG25_250150 [Weissella oryzae SG25]|uniref:Uncharacterized protein n=1 Tax=Weissella oryzae (strain DSM 25784 / JCM 18191 / LMG 30913 / SG25) TaxID=1329250 RepID=A0A069CX39_WEIOS|nr:hypothetical protein [Weissella oryzae]GAK32044.1 hypothetical protein WOSG25_250150 [Weissella oryzae SG25]